MTTKMDIDVTELSARELIRVLELYPQGRLIIKSERVFWSSSHLEPVRGNSFPGNNNQARTNNKFPYDFEKAADVLGSMMGPPR